MAEVTLRREQHEAFEIDSYWWDLYVAEARGQGWAPEGWNPVLTGAQQVSATEAAQLADALDRVLASPPSSDAISRDDLSRLITFLRGGAFTREVRE